MSNSPALKALRSAILEERITRADAERVLERYTDFTGKLTEFQTNEGPPPTTEEFERWRDDIILEWAVRETHLKAMGTGDVGK